MGSQNTLFSKNIMYDVWRVEQGHADLFLLVVDEPIYDKMVGVRSLRGRKPLHEGFLPALFQQGVVLSFDTPFGFCRKALYYVSQGLSEAQQTKTLQQANLEQISKVC